MKVAGDGSDDNLAGVGAIHFRSSTAEFIQSRMNRPWRKREAQLHRFRSFFKTLSTSFMAFQQAKIDNFHDVNPFINGIMDMILH